MVILNGVDTWAQVDKRENVHKYLKTQTPPQPSVCRRLQSINAHFKMANSETQKAPQALLPLESKSNPEQAQAKYPNPFNVADDSTDVVFIVEGEKLHFNRTVLGMFSPVFKAMFTSDFKEKRTEKILLPGKTLKDVVPFLEQIHPKHSARPITDGTLPIILKLSDEYQAETLRLKCSQYIGTQTELKVLQRSLSDDLLLLYLWMCEQYGLNEHRERLLELCTKRKSTELLECKLFQSIPLSASIELMTRRNAKLEDGVSIIWKVTEPRMNRSCHYATMRNPDYKCEQDNYCDNCAFYLMGCTIEDIDGHIPE